jgi:hypothetical protein
MTATTRECASVNWRCASAGAVSLRNFAVFAVTVKEVADAAASSGGCEPVCRVTFAV